MKTNLFSLLAVNLAVWHFVNTTSLNAQLIYLRSDANTQAAATSNLSTLDTGNTVGLTFQPALVGNYGSWTPVPFGAPAGTEVINIPPGASEGTDGQHGFFKVSFTLPVLGSNALLTGWANVDDAGRAFLNGEPLSPSLTSGDPNTIVEFGDRRFWTTSLNTFRLGYNELLISDWNNGGGPSGAAFYAIIYPAGLIQWVGGPGYWSNVTQWSPAQPTTDALVELPDGAEVIVDVADAQSGGLTVASSATVLVQSSGNLTLTGPGVNHGTVDISTGGQVGLSCGASGGGVGLVQNGTLNIGAGGQVALGGGAGFEQTGGNTTVGGTLAVSGGIGGGGVGVLNVQDGTLTVNTGGQVLAGGSNSGGYGLTHAGGTTLVNGTLNMDAAAQVQNGSFTVGASGTVCLGCGSSGGGTGLMQSGGHTTVSGTLNANNGIQVQDGNFTLAPGGTVCLGGACDSGGVGFTLSGGQASIDGTLNLHLNVDGGTVSGSGTINGNAGINGGVLSPGSSPGTLTVSENFALNENAMLVIELGGREPNQYDQLRVLGGAGLAGSLTVRVLPTFAPALGDQFLILTSDGGRSGEFRRLELPQGITVTYTRTSVVLVVTGPVPVQILGPALSNGNLVFSFATANSQSYTVEYSDDLWPAHWQVHSNLTGNGALLEFTAPVADAPQRFFRVRQP
ncbi:MAG: hypothetical protein NTW21_12450 [Verrucomicrobia bacterium]|nr:hypothetical protein [Verrucomicrobiota bacterium]